jgi:hypothetical protein
MEAVRRVHQDDAIRFALGDPERVLLPGTEPLVRFQRISLNPTDGFVLSRVDGTLSARQVLEITPLPREQVEVSLVGLLSTGMIEAAPPEPTQAELENKALRQEILDFHAALAKRNHREVLGVSAEATGAGVGMQYYGTKGCAEARYDAPVRISGDERWEYPGLEPEPTDPVRAATGTFHGALEDADPNKQKAFIASIVSGKPVNEAASGAEAALSGMLARTAAYTGKEITWEKLLRSKEVFDPRIDWNQFA